MLAQEPTGKHASLVTTGLVLVLLLVKLVAFSAVSSVDDVGFDYVHAYTRFELFTRRNHSVGSASARSAGVRLQ